ncbi:uroporphyrinogen decarboxylase, partial [Thermoflexus sp.]|uniref:uroporphyrinogen decarboxylase n=1 Tax=Thermoflexus sp. TaxID=1969742 RepID=UPI002ADE0FEC
MTAFNDRFLRACRRERVNATPVWFMRQAGRYLPEYRALRERYGFLELCRHPELAAEITRMPLRRFEVDAAILFSDLSLPLLGMGIRLAIREGVGPVIESPIQRVADLARLRLLEPEIDLPFVLETIRGLRAELRVPLIGFVGGPFTVACYLVEGRASRDFSQVRALMFREPGAWHALMERLTESLSRYARAQADAGVHALQIFESWIGVLNPLDYRRFVHPYLQRLIASLRPAGIPVILFGTGTGALLEDLATAGGTVIGLDWRVPLNVAWARLGEQVAVQGNLDPAVLLAPIEVVVEHAARILCQAGGRPGHIFNTGHGLLPETPPDTVAQLVDWVHA